MILHKRVMNVFLLVGVLSAVTPGGGRGADADRAALTDVVVGWNERVFSIAVAEDRLLTLKGLRTASMMHLAMHDALNAIDRRYEAFAYDEKAPGANPVAAVAQAAFDVVSNQYPDRWQQLESQLASELASVQDEAGRSAGTALGKACAAAALENREGDGWDTDAEYSWHPMGPGVYAEFNEHSGTPEGFIFGSGWAKAIPFVLERPEQFRSPPPPAIDSDEYTAAYREVKEVGRFQTMSRTPDQTHLALWWKDFIENSHNRLARQLASSQKLTPWVAARMFALLNISIYDAYISSFDNKFFYNHWRPYTAIRWAAYDGNTETQPDTLWDNTHRHTYAFPSYPSAHGTASAAAATILADTFGDDLAFTMSTPVVDIAGPLSDKISMYPPTRSFGSFSQAALECSMSRVYLGIHFRYDSVEGNELGKKVGTHITGNALRPVD